MGNPEWSKNPRYQNPIAIRDYPDEVDQYLEPWLMGQTKNEVLETARKYKIAITPIQTIDEVMDEPHFRERESFISLRMSDGDEVKVPSVPYRFSRTPCRKAGVPPKLGEHNEDILCGRLDYKKKDLVSFRRTGVI
jgi:crotonobetainyl-CoA:carnitine CoA-transferase CaiB-like acyl-CoA transferase